MSAETLRPIADFPAPVDPSALDAKADLAWIEVECLLVDESYQRGTDERAAQALLQRIASTFSWRRFGALVVAPAPDQWPQKFVVIDGQHRAAAAKARGISAVPCVVISAEGTEAPSAFSAINRDRRALTSLALFHASLAAGDADSIAIRATADEVGVTILRSMRLPGHAKPGETAAVGALRRVMTERGAGVLARVLRALRGAEFAPISGVQILALAELLCAEELNTDLPADAEVARCMRDNWPAIVDAAMLLRLDSDQPKTRCTAIEIGRACRGADS